MLPASASHLSPRASHAAYPSKPSSGSTVRGVRRSTQGEPIAPTNSTAGHRPGHRGTRRRQARRPVDAAERVAQLGGGDHSAADAGPDEKPPLRCDRASHRRRAPQRDDQPACQKSTAIFWRRCTVGGSNLQDEMGFDGPTCRCSVRRFWSGHHPEGVRIRGKRASNSLRALCLVVPGALRGDSLVHARNLDSPTPSSFHHRHSCPRPGAY